MSKARPGAWSAEVCDSLAWPSWTTRIPRCRTRLSTQTSTANGLVNFDLTFAHRWFAAETMSVEDWAAR